MKESVAELLFDERVSAVMARLEGGPAPIKDLAEASGTGEAALMEMLGPLIKAGILRADDASLSVDKGRLDEALEADQARFDGVVDGLTKMDGYLN